MYSIRGAITAQNTQQSIVQQTQKLYETIISTNSITNQRIDCVFVSTTKDLTAAYAAKGIRQSKLYDNNTALLSLLEPEIDNSLNACIRLLVQVDGEWHTGIQHIYLDKAKILRPDIAHINIALDGPAGAGKSTIAKILAKKLGVSYLDTGAMYRALALKLIQQKTYLDTKSNQTQELTFDPSLAQSQLQNAAAQAHIDQILSTTQIEFGSGDKQGVIYLDGVDVSSQIREQSISIAASTISANPSIRTAMVALQQQIASQTSCVLDGRDIGTVVLPNADYKFFITASVDERANRRLQQIQNAGGRAALQQVKQDIMQRDHNDTTRKASPLQQASDALLLDTTSQTVEQTIQTLLHHLYCH